MIYAVILAGGKGLRLGGDIPKQLLPLAGKPVIRWSAETFQSVDEIDSIIVVGEKNSLETIKSMLPEQDFPKIISFIEGGAERSDSSYNALLSREFSDDDIILFHDAARPFITADIIRAMITEIKVSGAAGIYIPAVDTVTIAENSKVITIPERRQVFYAQTPQGFRYNLIKSAHEKYKKGHLRIKATDDVSLVMAIGHDVKLVNGTALNFKITTDFDYRIAEFIAGNGLVK
ncbi:MAG TPA: 2-C-methyl-D-erythritol 4-phosphate cytidylyltransferase [Spirochaetota bacterium]|nr:2-C-methyl-D-erythritol 4-phosphate cytidylyltransferase [Spirochaetota bacterium]HPJ42234.1 2-C-methyl-D-erythritol 4-phosphate cytidylyltransferase [Spirochaetota bacterium]HPR36758.1 2-C-methyl-D-erythritol 4-phosphate cytidylyltransferase [Spirochaetota bacterium]